MLWYRADRAGLKNNLKNNREINETINQTKRWDRWRKEKKNVTGRKASEEKEKNKEKKQS